MSNSKKSGFTLLEVIVAVAVVSIALVPLLALMNFTFINSSVSANRLVAMNLAQEGVEAVRNNRDSENNWTGWYSSTKDGDYRAEISLTSPYQWTLEKDPSSYQLRYNSNLGLYHYENNGDPLSIFSRKIHIEKVSDVRKKVVVTINWTSRKRNYSLVVEHRLYNWHW